MMYILLLVDVSPWAVIPGVALYCVFGSYRFGAKNDPQDSLR